MYHYEYTYYIRGLDGQVLAESEDHDDKFLYRFIYANGQRIVLYDKNNRRHFYLNDHLGSARVLVDSAGTKRDVYKYYAFGSRAGGTAGTNQAYRYTGKPFDEELDLDLYYYGARYYYPEIGRFPTVDPLHGKYPGWSPYVYTRNNPLRYIDPDGEAPRDLTLVKDIATHVGQKIADVGTTIVQTVTLTVSAGYQAFVSYGVGKVGVKSGADISLNPAMEVKDVTLATTVEARLGTASTSAGGSTSLVSGESKVGMDVSVMGISEAATVSNSGDVQVTSSARLEFGAGAAFGGVSIGIDPNAKANAPDVSVMPENLRMTQETLTP